MSKKERSWEKRLSGEPNKLMIDFVESLSFDHRLYRHDIAGSIAHAQMLAQQKIITQSDKPFSANCLFTCRLDMAKNKRKELSPGVAA